MLPTADGEALASPGAPRVQALPPNSQWKREDYVEALSRVYASACAVRGRSVAECGDVFEANVSPDLAEAAVERALARAEDAGDRKAGARDRASVVAPQRSQPAAHAQTSQAASSVDAGSPVGPSAAGSDSIQSVN